MLSFLIIHLTLPMPLLWLCITKYFILKVRNEKIQSTSHQVYNVYISPSICIFSLLFAASSRLLFTIICWEDWIGGPIHTHLIILPLTLKPGDWCLFLLHTQPLKQCNCQTSVIWNNLGTNASLFFMGFYLAGYWIQLRKIKTRHTRIKWFWYWNQTRWFINLHLISQGEILNDITFRL